MSPPPNSGSLQASHSTAAVARLLGVSIPTIQRWVDLGHLKAWKTVGGHRRIDAASVEIFMLERGGHDEGAAGTADRSDALAVLIVDDNPDDRDVLAALVSAALPSAVVCAVDNGFDALLTMGQKTHDVLITDIVMPYMDGFEMLKYMAAQGPNRPAVVVAVSSRTTQELTKLGSLPEGVRFVPKPLDPNAFVATLRTAVGALTAVAA